MQFCAYVAIQCNLSIITAIFLKKRFWANILCNFVYKLQLNAILFKKKVFFALFFMKTTTKKHEIAIKILII